MSKMCSAERCSSWWFSVLMSTTLASVQKVELIAATTIIKYKWCTKTSDTLILHSVYNCFAGCFSLYVQLPTAAAHEYHIDSVVDTSMQPATTSNRLHPNVSQKIREIVSGGELRQYYIRHLLRFVLCSRLKTYFSYVHYLTVFLCVKCPHGGFCHFRHFNHSMFLFLFWLLHSILREILLSRCCIEKAEVYVTVMFFCLCSFVCWSLANCGRRVDAGHEGFHVSSPMKNFTRTSPLRFVLAAEAYLLVVPVHVPLLLCSFLPRCTV